MKFLLRSHELAFRFGHLTQILSQIKHGNSEPEKRHEGWRNMEENLTQKHVVRMATTTPDYQV